MDILNYFINFPQLEITSEKYPFKSFDFLEEDISDTDFNFPKHLIMGMQAEACFRAYLQTSKNYELLVSNLQIYGSHKILLADQVPCKKSNERETLGELDFIVRNLINNKTSHIELACKFYLYDFKAGIFEEEKWIGPNRKDRLSEKLQKICKRQFPILHQPETIHRLQELEIPHPTEQFLCLKAFLFIPKELEISTLSLEFQNCVMGYWIRESDFNFEDTNALYSIPHKREWLLPYNKIANWISFSQAKNEITNLIKQNKSPLIYRKQSDKIDAFFVVWW